MTRKTSKMDSIEDDIIEAKLRIEEEKRKLKAWKDHLINLEKQKEVLMRLVV